MRVGALHVAVEEVELLDQLRGVVLIIAVVVLRERHEFPLNRGQPVRHGLGRPLPQLPDLRHRPVEVADPVAQLQQQIELALELLGGGRDPRIGQHLNGLGSAPAVRRNAHLISARHHQRPERRAAVRRGVPRIPDETVQPCPGEGALLLEEGRLRPRDHRRIRRILLIGEAADDFAGAVEDLEGHFALGGFREPGVDRGAVRGIRALAVPGDAGPSVEVAGVRDRPPAAHVLIHRFLFRGSHPMDVPRREKVRRRRRDIVRQLVERRQVVQDPEGTALGGQDQILLVDHQVGDRRHREVELQRLPVPPVVERDEHPVFGAGVEESLPVRVLAHHPHELVGRDPVRPVGEEFPAFAEVVGTEHVGPEVVEPEADHRDEGAPGRVR